MSELTPYDTGEVLQPFPWLGEGMVDTIWAAYQQLMVDLYEVVGS